MESPIITVLVLTFVNAVASLVNAVANPRAKTEKNLIVVFIVVGYAFKLMANVDMNNIQARIIFFTIF